MLHLEKRGRVWYAVGQVHRRRFHQSLKTTDRTVAESLRRDLELQVLSGGRLRRILWPDFADEFERATSPHVKKTSLDVYLRTVRRFGKFFEGQNLQEVSSITPTTVADYTEDRGKDCHPSRGERIGAEGVKADLRILHRVLAYAVECGYLTENPVRYKNLSGRHGKTMPFNEEELVRILQDEVLKRRPYLRAVVLTFLFTGMRRSDVIAFPIEALELSEGRMMLRTQKRGRPVTLGLHPALQQALEVHLAFRTQAQKASPFVFTTSKGKVSRGIDYMLTQLFQRCGIVNGHPHRFRDTFAVKLLAQGASLYDVAKLLGINVATAERHYAPYVRELQERATKLIGQLSLPGQKVVQFCVPQEPTEDHFGQRKSEDFAVLQIQKGAAKS